MCVLVVGLQRTPDLVISNHIIVVASTGDCLLPLMVLMSPLSKDETSRIGARCSSAFY